MRSFRTYCVCSLLVFFSMLFGKALAMPLSEPSYKQEISVRGHHHTVKSHHHNNLKVKLDQNDWDLDYEETDSDTGLMMAVDFSSTPCIAWKSACLEKRTDQFFAEGFFVSKRPVYLLNQNFRL